VGPLSSDVTSSNISSFYNAIANCSDATQPVASIVYDVDGSIVRALGMDNNSTLGFAENICADDAAGIYTRSWSVLNGRFIDGSASTASHQTVSLSLFTNAFIHEFGHIFGLDHSQINLNCLTNAPCSTDDMAGLPIMFPILLDNSTSNLKTDDIAALSSLYPAASFSLTTGHIQGRVLFADGITPAQGYNVIARRVGDPRRTAVSCVSGFLFTAASGNSLVPTGYDTYDPYGSRLAYYDIPGLPPGNYTIEVEAIYNTGANAFIGGSGVGPIGSFLNYQFAMPGTCSLQYLNYPSSPGDSCSAYTTIAVGAGLSVNTHTDVTILGTGTRYDAWEDGP